MAVVSIDRRGVIPFRSFTPSPPISNWSRYVCTEDHLYNSDDFLWRCGPSKKLDMVSRRKILSRSRDELRADADEEEDVWFQKEKLLKDHIQEVLNKWGQIDDEIWAKIIVMERNRRVAKAYARAPVLTISGSDDGFDGYRIGLCGFDNPMRDAKTDELKKHIGHGVKIKMDEGGNIMVKRTSKSNIYVKEINTEENSIANEIIAAGGLLELEKPVKLFDMKKFTSNVNRELRRAYPDRRKLESQCISALSFVKDWPELLDCSCWVMVINVVALDMLKSKLPPLSKRQSTQGLSNGSEKSRFPTPQEEDPYSVPSLETTPRRASRLSKEGKPPKLPPRDMNRVPVPLPDYDDSKIENTFSRRKPQQLGYKDDPYYCGMKARVPNFAKKEQQRLNSTDLPMVRKSHSAGYLSLLRQSDRLLPLDTDSSRDPEWNCEESFSRVFGKMRSPPAPYSLGQLYVGEWE